MKEHNEKRLKARLEARPKKIMEIEGWEILVDERNYITRNSKNTYYFTTLENALWDISSQLDKGKIKGDLENAVKAIKESKKDFLKALSTAVAIL